MTAMMALFLVLWLIGLIDEEKKDDIARYFKDPSVFGKGKGMMPGKDTPIEIRINPPPVVPQAIPQELEQDTQDLKEEIKQSLEEGELYEHRDKIQVRETEEGLEISVVDRANSVMFPVGSSQPTPEMSFILKTIAKELKGHGAGVMIGGHTDARPLLRADGYTNWELSSERANRARAIMVGAGLGLEQIATVRGFAQTRPFNPKDPLASENRRISIVVKRS